MPQLPKARTSDIIELEADHELLIYDLRTNKAYNLNQTSQAVYRACGSSVSFGELKRRHKFTDDLIYLTLGELAAHNLIEDYQSDYFAGLSRREVIRKVGLASMVALPVISSLVVPSAAQAASQVCTRPGGTNCICPQNTTAGTTCGQGITFVTSNGDIFTPCDTGCACRSTGCGINVCGGACQ